MRIRDLFYETFSAIQANRGRSLLTILGIVIGIAAVISMTALIDGIKASLVDELGLSQSRTVMIDCWTGREITMDDVSAFEAGMPDDYEFITAASYDSGSISNGVTKEQGNFMGVEPKYFEAMGTKAIAGRLFMQSEDDAGSRVIVLDQSIANRMWGSEGAAVGQSVHLGNDDYTVVGVVGGSGMRGGYSFVPLATMRARMSGGGGISQIIGFAREDADMDGIVARTKSYLRSYFNLPAEATEEPTGEGAPEYYIGVTTMASVIEQLDSTMGAFQALMTCVAGVSLVVGGIGIMNMMLTNVTERIREIGLRKALGARRSDITRQFLLESIMLCLVGGAFGILLGYAGASVLAQFASMSSEMGGLAVRPVISPTAVGLASGICVGIGVLFGFYPAWRASRLDPVESLRYQ
ncbi:MAG: ABC transporter permease [Coriobacteriaceae bacterium]|uniref:ABC transporter permease n=1 Tax=Tractidigestivibacter sp. TaxID=2847320 RepID=UPI002A817303|nr:ABC transporter permease [Tractidigestivibacter sp.]MCI6548367.1 ABC transporter permease [Coriobacteriaceae bacterium]MCI6845138.1 ABC transporter permease [Coriobacteriaceae bacterium]MCI7437738.1 ABC transporter permease [Coriobacteriaceae bacterium]MDD7583633.1 ABC transporter permease [Coriobacteriaceae bacterium]MDY4534201.1 ABC transporter permease [Tractidigestivibacter sp.]